MAPGPQVFPPPAPPRRWPARTFAWAALALVLVGAVVATAVWWGTRPAPTDEPTVEVTGGDIGTPVELTAPGGTGKVTVTRARWTSEGEVAPQAGTSYLIVDAELEGVTGELTTGGMFTVVVAGDGQRHGLSFGPILDPVLPSATLRPGETNAGQLGYQLSPGSVELEFQTPDGAVLGSVAIPGP